MDAVFKALADSTRRSLLDELFREDGQTLKALEERFSMTRFGVMKHLKQLEEAGLVVTRRRGREKVHYLNTVPIRLVHDRWVSKYAEPWAAALSGLKQELGEFHGEGFRDLHPDYPGAPLGGDHRPRDQKQVQLRHPGQLGLDDRLALRGEPPVRPRALG
ncbi:MAG: helix-turn-helix domain-containing protein [Nocardioidaceae bacterium]